jgi:hypothetical protein
MWKCWFSTQLHWPSLYCTMELDTPSHRELWINSDLLPPGQSVCCSDCIRAQRRPAIWLCSGRQIPRQKSYAMPSFSITISKTMAPLPPPDGVPKEQKGGH